MTSLRKILLSTAVAAFATPALAADVIESIPTPPVAIEVPFTWTGAYVGGQVGFLNANIDLPPGQGFGDADGVIGGFHLGYNYQFVSGLVLGAYVDYDFADADIGFVPLGSTDAEIDAVARGMVKVGYGIGRGLIYAQGGVAYVSADVDNSLLAGRDDSEFGYAVGAGLDFAVTDNVIVGADYLCHNVDGFGIDGVADTDVDVNAHTFRAKFSYKF